MSVPLGWLIDNAQWIAEDASKLEPELKPCPFKHRGLGEPKPCVDCSDDGFYFVKCPCCGVIGPRTTFKELAIALWNSRAT